MKTVCACYRIRLQMCLLVVLCAAAPLGLPAQEAPDKTSGTLLLADGIPIHLVLMDDLQSKNLRMKQEIHFKVREDVVVGSKAMVKTGAEAIGHIEKVSKSGLLGKSGRLVIQFDYVNAIAGTKILLRGGAGVSGGKGGALTWESALWYGPNANLPVGTVINAYIKQDQRMAVP